MFFNKKTIITLLIGLFIGITTSYFFFSGDNVDDLSQRKDNILEQEKIIIEKNKKTREDFQNAFIEIIRSNYIVTISNQTISW